MKSKSICFLAPANNYHTQKWCKWFSEKGYFVHVISFVEGNIDNVILHVVGKRTRENEKDLQKFRYFFYGKKIKSIITDINPDIISVHYASSYGLVAALTKLKDYKLSVWGSDIFAFPKKSFFHKLFLNFSLDKASCILATSKYLAEETRKYTTKEIEITPFGVDTRLFHPISHHKDQNKFIVGTIKALTPYYGIDYLIKAVAIIVQEHSEIPIELHIAGRGEKENEYKLLAQQLHISEIVSWLGYISQEEAALEWTKMDLAVLYSSAESFGVSALEAQACGIPLIVSDANGFLESSNPGKSAIIVPFGDEHKLADAIVNLYYDKEKRKQMGVSGREFIENRYELDQCFSKIEKLIL